MTQGSVSSPEYLASVIWSANKSIQQITRIRSVSEQTIASCKGFQLQWPCTIVKNLILPFKLALIDSVSSKAIRKSCQTEQVTHIRLTKYEYSPWFSVTVATPSHSSDQ